MKVDGVPRTAAAVTRGTACGRFCPPPLSHDVAALSHEAPALALAACAFTVSTPATFALAASASSAAASYAALATALATASAAAATRRPQGIVEELVDILPHHGPLTSSARHWAGWQHVPRPEALAIGRFYEHLPRVRQTSKPGGTPSRACRRAVRPDQMGRHCARHQCTW